MLVAEHWHDSATTLKGGGDLLEKSPARIHLLVRVGGQRIVAMLANAQHPRDLYFVRAQRDRLINRASDFESEPLRHLAA